MNYRTDKFKIGDWVTWFNDEWANLTGGRNRLGDGPFEIIDIDDSDFRVFKSVGHTQWPYILTKDGPERFSGAFFKVTKRRVKVNEH